MFKFLELNMRYKKQLSLQTPYYFCDITYWHYHSLNCREIGLTFFLQNLISKDCASENFIYH